MLNSVGDRPGATPGSAEKRHMESELTRCGARTQEGTPCRRFPVKGHARCRLHEGGWHGDAAAVRDNARIHSIYSPETLLDGEEADYARFMEQVGSLDHEITLCRIMINRGLKADAQLERQREEAEAEFDAQNPGAIVNRHYYTSSYEEENGPQARRKRIRSRLGYTRQINQYLLRLERLTLVRAQIAQALSSEAQIEKAARDLHEFMIAAAKMNPGGQL